MHALVQKISLQLSKLVPYDFTLASHYICDFQLIKYSISKKMNFVMVLTEFLDFQAK